MNISLRKWLLSFLLFFGCSGQAFSSIPQDLMYEGSLIHPSIVVSTQFGDSSHYEPKPLVRDPKTTEEYLKKKKSSSELTYNVSAQTVAYKIEYFDEDIQKENEINDCYQYVGTYKGKHIILSESYDTSGTGRFGFLGMVKREGNNLVNAGEIASGDRGFGGIIRVVSFLNNVLIYEQCASIDMIISAFSDEHLGFHYPPIGAAGYLLYEVNLDDNNLSSRLIGLAFNDEKYGSEFLYGESKEELFERCFNTVADSYIKQGKIKLNYFEAQEFVNQVLQYSAKTYPSLFQNKII